MNDFRVIDIEFRDLHDEYNAILMCCSDEPRCTSVAQRVSRKAFEKCLVLRDRTLSLDAGPDSETTLREYFPELELVALPRDDPSLLIANLDGIAKAEGEQLRILVDYSSMPRLWYAGILRWAQTFAGEKRVELDLAYTISDYISEENFRPLELEDIPAIPGCDGLLDGSDVPILGIFGLGFDGIAASEVLEELEPSTVYAYLADPVPFPEYAERARKENREILNAQKLLLPLPLCSIRTVYGYLSELVVLSRSTHQVSLVPMGPKPHVVAAILVALRFEDVACLHVAGRREKPESAEPTDRAIVTRVQIRKPSEEAQQRMLRYERAVI